MRIEIQFAFERFRFCVARKFIRFIEFVTFTHLRYCKSNLIHTLTRDSCLAKNDAFGQWPHQGNGKTVAKVVKKAVEIKEKSVFDIRWNSIKTHFDVAFNIYAWLAHRQHHMWLVERRRRWWRWLPLYPGINYSRSNGCERFLLAMNFKIALKTIYRFFFLGWFLHGFWIFEKQKRNAKAETRKSRNIATLFTVTCLLLCKTGDLIGLSAFIFLFCLRV